MYVYIYMYVLRHRVFLLFNFKNVMHTVPIDMIK